MNSLSPSTLSAVAGVTALVGAFKGLTSSLGAVIDNYAHFEKLQMGLTTFFQDADKGKAKFEELRKLSNETTFGVDELTDSFTQLANVGVNVNSITDKLTMLGDLAQGDKAKFAELTSIYAKINSTGRAGAMQLQQIATRGIPIYDMLKKIGVQGTATADDITKAFEEMTKEGGQFYNAMNNINETIEGKEGFISDYFKEFTVNFAEVTGMANAYKDVLDGLKGAIGTVSDLLLSWNDNPVIKAIVTGAFSAILTGLVTIIGVSLVGALNTIIVKLGILVALKTALVGPAGMIALGVAGITALVMGVKSYSNSLEQAEKDQEALNKKLKEAQDLAHQGSNPVSNSRNNQLEQAKKDLDTYTKAKGKATAELQKAKKELQEYDKMIAEFEKSWSSDSGMTKEEWVNDNLWAMSLSNGTDNKSREDISAEVERWNNSLNSANTLIDQTRNKVQKLNEEIANFGDTDELKATFESVYDSLFKAEKEQATIQEQLDKVKMYRDQGGKYNNAGQLITFDNDTKIAIDNTIRYLENKLKGVNAWEDIFKSVTGIEVPKLGSNGKSRGQLAGEAYTARTSKQFEAQVRARTLLGDKNAEKTVATEFVKNIEKQIESLISNIDIDQPFAETDSTIKALNAELEKYKELVGEVSEKTISLSEAVEDWKRSNNVGTMVGGYAMGAVQSVGGDVGNFFEGMAQSGGNWIGGVINVLISALANVASSCENFERAINPVTTAFQKLKPLLQVFIDIGADFTSGLEMVLDILQPIIQLLGFVARVLRAVGVVANILLYGFKQFADAITNILGKLGIKFNFEDWNKSMDDWLDSMNSAMEIENEKADAERRQLEELKKQQEAYKSLLNAMEENENWYIRQKTALNANTRKGDFQSVNDMILTPQGQFSTHPDDYIIATKNPQGLGGAVVNVNIENTVSDVDVTATPINRNGIQEIMIQISRKIADDVANGANGWDSALSRQAVRTAGRQISF